jgi:hypothetical protein
MAEYSIEEIMGTAANQPAPKKVVVQPVAMPLPAASAPAPNPNAALVSAFQTRNANAAAAKVTTQAEIAEAAKRSGKSIEQVTRDAVAKGYKVQ